MIGVLSLVVFATAADKKFHGWCHQVGIESPLAELRTTSESVAGRGVFAVSNVEKGDIVITIPENTVFHEFNVASFLPRESKQLKRAKRKFENRNRWWRRLFHFRRPVTYEFVDNGDLWQGVLTSYCLGITKNYPDSLWSPWINQWGRSDPMQDAFEQGLTWRDTEAVDECVAKFSQMMPEISKVKLRAAVDMRLGRLEELQHIFGFGSNDARRMFGILTSRAIELGDGILGVIPMFDMINHSLKPNLGLSFDGEKFLLVALRDIAEGEELFIRYSSQESGEEWDETDALWALVQWGIPQPRIVSKPAVKP